MQFSILIAVLVALATAESEYAGTVPPAWRVALATAAALAGPIVAWLGFLRIAAIQNAISSPAFFEHQRLALASRCASLERWVMRLWLGGNVFFFTVGGWASVVRTEWNLTRWPLADELAILAPLVVSLLLVWTAFYWLEERVRGVEVLRNRRTSLARLARFLGMQVRQQLGLLIVPPLLVALGTDLAIWWGVGEAADKKGFLPAGLLGGMLAAMPLVLRQVWKTAPLPEGSLRQELLAIFRERKCAVTQLLLWHTGGRQANAAVVGLLPWLRYVLISDRLLAMLTRGELAAVLRHEIAHLKKGHLILRIAALTLPVAWWLAWSGGHAASMGVEQTIHHPAFLTQPRPLWASMAFPAGMLVYAWLVVGRYSRLLEHEADLEACLTEGGRFDPWVAEDLADALRVVVGREEEGWINSWLHPSLADRLAFLVHAQQDPAFITRFRRRLRGVAMALALLWVAAGWMVWLRG